MKHSLTLALTSTLMVAASHTQAAPQPIGIRPSPTYQQITQSVANMVSDRVAQRLVNAKKLNIVNVMWEDTGRYLGSSVGPNISDVTIEVQIENQRGQLQNYLMPVIRYPNFTDKTGDVDIDKFFIRIGNEKEGGKLRTVSLKQFLEAPTRYMSLPGVGSIKGGTLLAKRDKHILTSAQAAFLPVRKRGKATFWPVIFNYQSYAKNPAVLTLLVTRQGTSMTIVDNNRDTVSGGASWGQRLYFNAGGKRSPLTAERLADVKASGKTSNGEAASSLGKDANLLMIIQIPLKTKGRPMMALDEEAGMDMMAAPSGAGAVKKRATRGGSDMDVAVLGHGQAKGPYTELDGLTIERDPRFPIRATVQFYQATSNGIIDQNNVNALSAQIDKVYAEADYVGSLVVPEGDQHRPTRWDDATAAPSGLTWWHFAGLVERFEKYGDSAFNWYWRPFSR